MKRAEYINNELKDLKLGCLSAASNIMPYYVPENYFEQLTNSINSFTGGYIEENLSNQKSMPYSGMPDFYFDNLSSQIINKIKDEEIWTKKNPYTIPDSYFESLSSALLKAAKDNNIIERKKTKRIPLFRTVQLAASLVLVVFVGLGIFHKNQRQFNVQKGFEQLTSYEIEKYINDNIDDFDTDMVLNGMGYNTMKINKSEQNISSKEINEYMIEEGLY